MTEPEIRSLRGIAAALEAIASEAERGRAEGRHLDDVILQLGRVRRRLYGPRKLEGSARGRLRKHLIAHVGEWIDGEELAEIAGISEWARRIRELRDEGLAIEEENGAYRLDVIPV